MVIGLVLRNLRKAGLAAGAAAALAASTLAAAPGPAQAATSGPCDIYAAAGTPCVAAHSTTRALYAAYDGPLYQVKRASNGSTTDIYPLTAGGYANAATQTSFCAGTSCTITEIFDQSAHGNNLTIEGPGGNGGQDVGANADALPVLAGGHLVYGVYVGARRRLPGRLHHRRGHRQRGTGRVHGGQRHARELRLLLRLWQRRDEQRRQRQRPHGDDQPGHTVPWFAPCTGSGPWVMADLENGLFSGGNGSNTANDGNASTFVTALVKNNGTTSYAIKGGNAQSGGLSTWYNGALPDLGGYAPMHQEGAIVLGTGGDDSNSSIGSFFEGVMTSGYPTDAADNSVQANIVSVGYALPSEPATGEVAAGDDAAACMDNNNGSGTDGNKVQMWTCDGNTAAQNWTAASNGTLQIDGGCLDITGANYANGTLVEWWPCNGGANQQWAAEKGELVNPTSGKCLDDPASNKTNGTQLILYACNGGANQQWQLP